MNRPIAILILVIFFFSQVGYFFIYSVTDYYHEEEREEVLFKTISEKQCDIINLTAFRDSISWENEGTDFVLNGEDYDVVKEKVVDGKVYLLCISDKKESELLADMSLKCAADHNIGKDFSLIFGDNCILVHKLELGLIFCSKEIYPSHSIAIADADKKIILPPPQIQFS